MQLKPFDKFIQNSFKLFDRGYRPLRPIIATSKIDGIGLATERTEGTEGAMEESISSPCSLCALWLFIHVETGAGNCCGSSAVIDNTVTSSCSLFSKK